MSDETAGTVEPVPFSTALGERYLAYALSTITARSLPDVRDGLKPVHRRLVHAMRELGLDPAAGFKKCARVVGDVMGKYHPHGDAAIYDAMVRLAQEFAVRYPLVEGHGNFGNIDGDNAAAMRYTEARLTAVAEALLEGIDEDAVDFRETYDGEGREPEVLPAAFPNLLANGAQGIAVGMATNIPPHNAGELAAALLHLIRWPTAKDEKIAEHVPGPDFPTGGCLTEDPAAIAEAYRTGRGSMRVRARWEVEKLERGHWRAVVTEIPYQVQKARLLERLDAAIEARKLPAVEQVIDESAEDVRILLVPRNRSIDPAAMMEQAFRLSELEIRFGLNLNVLDAEGRPRVMSLRECLLAFIEHRMEVLERRTRYRLERIARRLEVLEAYLAVYLNLDEVIRIVREEDDPRAELCACLGVNEAQADAILAMRLRALRRLEEAAIREEHAKLTAEQAGMPRAAGGREAPAPAALRRGQGDAQALRLGRGRGAADPAGRGAGRKRRGGGVLHAGRAGDRAGVRDGLGARAERPYRRRYRAPLQGGRQRGLAAGRRDLGQAAAVRRVGPGLHRRGGPAAGRQGHGPAAAHACGHGPGGPHRVDPRRAAGRPPAAGGRGRARLRRARGERDRPDADGQAGDDRHAQGGRGNPPGRRLDRRYRPEPAPAGLPAGAGAGTHARARRAPAALRARRAGRCHGAPHGGRARLAHRRAHQAGGRPAHMARAARRRRPPAAARLPAQQPLHAPRPA